MNERGSNGNDQPVSELKLDVLPEAQRKLWAELSDTPDQFILYGGTAIALRLGHRQSIDFDFFAFSDIESADLLRDVPYLSGAKPARTQPNTLNVTVDRGSEVQVSFFGLPHLKQVRPPIELENPRIRLADMIDLAGMKMAVIQHRAMAKDYLDIHAIWSMTEITPEQSVACASIIYGEQYNPYDTLKALAYFGEPELSSLSDDLKSMLTEAARNFDMAGMKTFIEELKS